MEKSIEREYAEAMPLIEDLYDKVNRYAEAFDRKNTKKALRVSEDVLCRIEKGIYPLKPRAFKHYMYGLDICKRLIELRLPISGEEEDTMLSAALGHVMVEITDFPRHGIELVTGFQFAPETYEIIRLIAKRSQLEEISDEEFFRRIQKNPLALMIRLEEKCSLLEHLYQVSSLQAQEYIRVTREFIFPMCIYGKEHYPYLSMPISILMEKMRMLSDVTEILTIRHNARKTALVDAILTTKEENARIRVSIRELWAERDAEGND